MEFIVAYKHYKNRSVCKNFLVFFSRTHTYTLGKKKIHASIHIAPEQLSKLFRMNPPNFFYYSASHMQLHPTDWTTASFLANHLTDHHASHAKPCLATILS